mmetsp:Transcript_84704/g.146935  ORF Transcript_84704/g.146935 Transcript_84704/m.146935 type:complete len:299 (-) Transcript_84704:147-1043(-)
MRRGTLHAVHRLCHTLAMFLSRKNYFSGRLTRRQQLLAQRSVARRSADSRSGTRSKPLSCVGGAHLQIWWQAVTQKAAPVRLCDTIQRRHCTEDYSSPSMEAQEAATTIVATQAAAAVVPRTLTWMQVYSWRARSQHIPRQFVAVFTARATCQWIWMPSQPWGAGVCLLVLPAFHMVAALAIQAVRFQSSKKEMHARSRPRSARWLIRTCSARVLTAPQNSHRLLHLQHHGIWHGLLRARCLRRRLPAPLQVCQDIACCLARCLGFRVHPLAFGVASAPVLALSLAVAVACLLRRVCR